MWNGVTNRSNSDAQPKQKKRIGTKTDLSTCSRFPWKIDSCVLHIRITEHYLGFFGTLELHFLFIAPSLKGSYHGAQPS